MKNNLDSVKSEMINTYFRHHNIQCMIEEIEFKNEKYPKLQSQGFAAKFAFPFALQVCCGFGYDVGCNRLEWRLPGAMAWDIAIDPEQDAKYLPKIMVDFIFSSHCLEHLQDWVDVLDHWGTRIKSGGVLFLYLPDYSQNYWRPWNNRKHKNIFTPEIVADYMQHSGYHKIYKSGTDLNNSFMIMGEKITTQSLTTK